MSAPTGGCNGRWAERWWRLKRETEQLSSQIRGRTGAVAQVFDRVSDVLLELGYLESHDGVISVAAPGRALRRIYGEMPGVDAVPVSGTPDDVVRGVAEVIDAGAEMVLLNPVGYDVAENREQMERLAAEVIPRLG